MASTTTPSSSSKPTLPLPSTFSQDQASKAVTALFAHHQKVRTNKEKTELISREEHVWLCVNTKVMPKKKSNKPIRIQLPFPPLPPPPTTSVCLISKTPQREYKDLLAAPSNDIKFISRVVGVEKLRGKHAPYEAKRRLVAEHDTFLCDERVMEMMPKLLGKYWFDAKKQPIPVNLTRKDLKGELSRAISSTYFHESLGTSTSIRIATASHHTAEQTLSNLLSALPQIVSRLQARHVSSNSDAPLESGWALVHSIGIKTSGSMMLPIWNCKLDERFSVVDGVAVKNQKRKKGLEEDVEMEEEEVKEKKGKKSKGKVMEEAVKAVKATSKSPAKKDAAKSPSKVEKVVIEQAPVAPAPATAAAKKVMAGKPTADATKPTKKVSGATKAKPSAKQTVVGKKTVVKKAAKK